ncbi:MAG: Uma2 family endonuclease [Chloroflexi bacterium]|nr:Uma2 family endonuclease [Chloroflexota bacterium]
MIASLRPLTYDDLLDMPDDGQRYEIIGGEMIVTPSPTANHQRVLFQLIRLLDAFVLEHGGGELFIAPFDVQLGYHDIVEPDLLFIASDQGRIPGEQHKFEGAPNLVVEVISPSSRQTDRVKKMALYARSGVHEYWIVDPEQRVLVVNVLEGQTYVPVAPHGDGWLTSRALPGLRVDPSTIFAGLD